MGKQEEIARYMKKLGLSREEAEQLWLDDNSNVETEEQKELGAKAKKNGTDKVTARKVTDPAGKTRTREKKVDADKRLLMQDLFEMFASGRQNAVLINPERQIDFEHNGKRYSVTLTQHRDKKKQD